MGKDRQQGTVFITVGTTEFDTLIKSIDTASFLATLHKHGFTCLNIQIGRGAYEPNYLTNENGASYNINISWFRFKANLSDDMNNADLIISHCGAGSILEAVTLKKQLIVVVNTSLQDNHQAELAEALVEGSYCLSAYPENVIDIFCQTMLEPLNGGQKKSFPINNPDLFTSILETL